MEIRDLEELLIKNGWKQRKRVASVSYSKDNIGVNIGSSYVTIEYFEGERMIESWLKKASIMVCADYDELEWSESSPYQIMFQGGYLKI